MSDQRFADLTPQTDPSDLAGAEELRSRHAAHVQALAVLHDGALVWEQYWGGHELDIIWPEDIDAPVELSEPYPASHDATEVHNLKSCTKSVMATLIGIALDKGDLPSADAPVAQFLPDYFADVDDERRNITVRHLLGMRSGLAWEENGQPTLDWMNAPDLVGFTLNELPLAHAPGDAWCYSTADSHLLSAVLQAATGRPALEYAREHLLGPLEVGPHRWTVDRQGRNIGGSELFLTLPDMLAFGELARNRGKWRGRRLVSSQWMDECVAGQPDVTAQVIREASTPPGMTWPDGVRSYPEGYGMQWWRTTLRDMPAFLAEGLGGQMIVVVDDLDLVVAMTATTELGDPEGFPQSMAAQFQLIEDWVIPAVSR